VPESRTIRDDEAQEGSGDAVSGLRGISDYAAATCARGGRDER